MMDLLQDVNLLEHLLPAETVSHVLLIETLDGYLFPRQFMNAKSHLPKSSFANLLDQFVVFRGGLWNLIVSLNMVSDLDDQLLPV